MRQVARPNSQNFINSSPYFLFMDEGKGKGQEQSTINAREGEILQHKHVTLKEKFLTFYKHNYRKILLIPILLLLLSLGQIFFHYYTTGDFITKGIALTGGIGVEVQTTSYTDIISLKEQLTQQFPDEELDVRIVTHAGKQKSFIVETGKNVAPQELQDKIREIVSAVDPAVKEQQFRVQEISGEFASDFFKTTLIAVIVAFILMAIVVTIYFRVVIPSAAVVLAAFSDIFITVAVFNILGMKLAPGGIAAFLMLIGYSVDTDILLTTRALKEKIGTIDERIWSAFTAGILMSLTAIAAVTVGYFFSQADILKQIMLVLFIGLVADIINTWLQNAAILRWYLEKHGER